MKCLSICQPFANLIIQNKKTIELRKWNTNFRGVFLIHAPIKIRKEDCKRLKINEEFTTCLLYTSPSPRDKRQSRMPSSA